MTFLVVLVSCVVYGDDAQVLNHPLAHPWLSVFPVQNIGLCQWLCVIKNKKDHGILHSAEVDYRTSFAKVSQSLASSPEITALQGMAHRTCITLYLWYSVVCNYSTEWLSFSPWRLLSLLHERVQICPMTCWCLNLISFFFLKQGFMTLLLLILKCTTTSVLHSFLVIVRKGASSAVFTFPFCWCDKKHSDKRPGEERIYFIVHFQLTMHH